MQRVLPEVSVLSQTRFPEAVGSGAEDDVRPEFILKSKTSPNSSPNCMPKRLQIVLFAPPYSFEIISFPGFTIPLLTDRLKVRFLPRPPFRSCRKNTKGKIVLRDAWTVSGVNIETLFESANDYRRAFHLVEKPPQRMSGDLWP